MSVFTTGSGIAVPAITAEQMLEVDRIATEEFGLRLLQMMENAGRNLARVARDMLSGADRSVVVLAGKGGNGGGGLCCVRHLHNHGVSVRVFLTGEEESLSDGPASQLKVLKAAGVVVGDRAEVEDSISSSHLVVDALIGYSLRGAPSGQTADLIQTCDGKDVQVLSLDVPSGVDATTGESPGLAIRPDCTLTLALPKTGLVEVDGDLLLADIGIPREVYRGIGVAVPDMFHGEYWIPIERGRKG
jgi:NAD(P)H-hydrate epimerase